MEQGTAPGAASASARRRGWVQRVLWVVASVAAGIALGDALNARVGWFASSVPIPVQAGTTDLAGAWQLRPARPVKWRGAWPGAIRLQTAASCPLAFVPNPTWVTRLPATAFSLDRSGHLLLNPAWAASPAWWAGRRTLRFPRVMPEHARTALWWFAAAVALAGAAVGAPTSVASGRPLVEAPRGARGVVGRPPRGAAGVVAPVLILGSGRRFGDGATCRDCLRG